MLPGSNYFLKGEIHEECGVFGVYNVADASSIAYFGLHALQHRGQEASGIAVSDGHILKCIKGKGLLTDTFNADTLSSLDGIHAIGHVRYSTAGGNEIENVQPMMVRSHLGHFAISHNGNIVNYKELKEKMEDEGSIFQGTSDSEIIGHLIQRGNGTFEEKITQAAKQIEGGFAFIVMRENCMYAVRDPNGLRPMSIAKIENGYCISSETCAFDIINGKFIRDLEPGEICKINEEGIKFFKYTDKAEEHMCAMEYIYFARPDSRLNGMNIHTARRLSGQILAEKDIEEGGLPNAIVVGVPDSSLSAALGYSEASGLPYETGLIKNRYVGRTFIQPTQRQRERGVRMKLSAVTDIVSGRNVIMIDDSIVRGTTSRRIVQLLKEAGALSVHVRIASPPIAFPCFYGVDTSTRAELISSTKSIEQVRDYIHADSLKFLDIDDLEVGFRTKKLCTACFSGKYPTNLFSLGEQLKKEMSNEQ